MGILSTLGILKISGILRSEFKVVGEESTRGPQGIPRGPRAPSYFGIAVFILLFLFCWGSLGFCFLVYCLGGVCVCCCFCVFGVLGFVCLLLILGVILFFLGGR